MELQPLLALVALVSVPTVSLTLSPSTPHHPIVRTPTLEVITAAPALSGTSLQSASESRYPGVIVIATEATRDRAFLVCSKLSESGVTTIMYLQDPESDYLGRMLYAEHAIDSMRRRVDIRPEEVGVIGFGDGVDIIPELARDTALSFAIASTERSMQDIAARYARARAATLIIQGVDAPPPEPVGPKASMVTQGVSTPLPETAPVTVQTEIPFVAPSVTVWAVPKTQLRSVGESHSTLAGKILAWIREQVHTGTGPLVQQQAPMTIK